MNTFELIIRTLGSLSDDLVNVKDDMNNIIIDLEMLKRALMRLTTHSIELNV